MSQNGYDDLGHRIHSDRQQPPDPRGLHESTPLLSECREASLRESNPGALPAAYLSGGRAASRMETECCGHRGNQRQNVARFNGNLSHAKRLNYNPAFGPSVVRALTSCSKACCEVERVREDHVGSRSTRVDRAARRLPSSEVHVAIGQPHEVDIQVEPQD